MTPNKITTDMDDHLEAHPPNIVWGKAVKGVQHGTVIEEIPLPKPGANCAKHGHDCGGDSRNPKAPNPEESLRPFELTLDADDLT